MNSRELTAVSSLAVSVILFAMAAPAMASRGYTGDLDGDWDVDFVDLNILLASYDIDDGGDLDGDGDTDSDDVNLLLANYGTALHPDMVLVPAGEFEMGDSFDEGASDELPVHAVYLDSYCMDSCEVTNEQYAAYLNSVYAQGGLIEISGGVVHKAGDTVPYCNTSATSTYSRIHFNGETFTVTAGKEDHPMLLVSWYGAVAYTNWRSELHGRTPCYDLGSWTCDFGTNGYRLPTEAEWEKAAAWDPVQARHYRFGEHTDGCGYTCLDGQRANYNGSGDPFEGADWPATTPVDYYDGSNHDGYQTQDAQSYYGCRGMTGNISEWCHDWYRWGYYGSSPFENPTGPSSGVYRVHRGGYWFYVPSHCRTALRIYYNPDFRGSHHGFRCLVRCD